jgi:plasmid maintenance system killer protein
MIKSFKHRGLKRLYERGDRSGIRPQFVDKVERILARLDEANSPQALDIPGYRLHPSRVITGDSGVTGRGKLANHFSVSRGPRARC